MPMNESFTELEVYELRKQVQALTSRVSVLEGTKKANVNASEDERLLDLIHRFAAREATVGQVRQAISRHDRLIMKAALRVAANRFEEGFDGDADVVMGLRALADDIP
jgi:uncharacterized coiled-coil protein SlyX